MAERRRLAAGALAVTAAGAAGLAWSTLVEPNWFVLRRATLPLLRPGSWPIRVLHLSDLHLVPGQTRKIEWVRSLADLRPDLVINTGDTLSDAKSVPAVVQAFGPLLDLPGAFVFGNNDYYAPRPKSPHQYFLRSKPRPSTAPLPWRDLRAAQTERGWIDLDNRRKVVTLRGQRIALAGVDDPHLGKDRYDRIAGPADPDAVVRIGVAHSPEPRVLDGLAGDGYDLVLAGHTHGGQVRLPGIGALVTNCGVDRSRARGLSTWGSRTVLNVSAGLGTNPYLPVRFCCRPEATLLTLVAAPEKGSGGGHEHPPASSKLS